MGEVVFIFIFASRGESDSWALFSVLKSIGDTSVSQFELPMEAVCNCIFIEQ
jgi:hypothetical protein